ncbi:MAG: hypothetical protein C0481_14555 [Phenylobacterium sp.]|uniref:LysR family transcriptional regulator substrate-binding protein n=1 Tax=Phenylobacterium sp. TaxID=1871053 RepID=UPI0025FC0FAA|nr:LysR family transcriptional regulator substrate-binding protein [Phenylobacterium sp.]MBA4013084.1 hypothetical protein [Phenylobacterium sp.]
MDLSHSGLHAVPVARSVRRDRLTLGLSCSLNWGPLRRLIAAYRVQVPNVDLIVEDLDDQGLADRVEGRGVDLAVALHDAGVPGWRSAPLWSEPLMVFMAEGHPLAAQNAVQPAQLRGACLLMAGAGSGDRALQRAIIRALGGPPNFLHYAVQRDNLLGLAGVRDHPRGRLRDGRLLSRRLRPAAGKRSGLAVLLRLLGGGQ